MTSQTNETQQPEFDMATYKPLYLREARGCWGVLRENLVRLQADPVNEAALREAARAAHTLKGMSATMHYDDLTALGREMEQTLQQAGEAEHPLSPERIDALLNGCDAFESGLDRLAADVPAE